MLCAPQDLLRVLCAAAEYDDLPVRHNEDRLNTAMAGQVRWPTDTRTSGELGGGGGLSGIPQHTPMAPLRSNL